MAAMIKYTCQRRRAAQQRGRKVSQLDERYLRRAEDQLYGELAVALGNALGALLIPAARRLYAPAPKTA